MPTHGTSNMCLILCKVRKDLRQDYEFGALGALGALTLGALGALTLGALTLGELTLGELTLGVLVLGALVLGALVLGVLVPGALGVVGLACADWLSVINAGAA